MLVERERERERERARERERERCQSSFALSLTVVDRNVGSARDDSVLSTHCQHVLPMWRRSDAVAGYDT